METQLLIKIVYMSAVSLACVVILARAMTLFKGVQGNQPNPAGRTAFVALQHLSMLVIVLTGIALLVMKNFDVQTWFYAKVVLFFLSYNLIGAFCWIGSFITLGYIFGNVPVVKDNFTHLIFGIIIISILPGIIGFIRAKLKKKINH
jgi:uncharacterized membrane protein SirB2